MISEDTLRQRLIAAILIEDETIDREQFERLPQSGPSTHRERSRSLVCWRYRSSASSCWRGYTGARTK
jgi:hypothetical protein